MIWSEMSYIKYSKIPVVCQEENLQDYIDYIDYDTENEFFDEDVADEFNSCLERLSYQVEYMLT